MNSVTATRSIDAPIERVWEKLDDFGGVSNFHPLIERSPITNGVGRGEGAARECHFYGGGSIKETVRAYAPGRGYTVEITDTGPFPLRRGQARIDVAALGPTRSQVVFRMDFEPKFGLLGKVMGKLMMERQFAKVLSQLLQGLDDHVRTGRRIGKGGELLEIPAA